MITKSQCKEIIDIALEHGKGKADGIEVHIEASDVATSRFANNGMTQNQCPEAVDVYVRAIIDGRQARVSSDCLSPDDIRRLVDKAIAAALPLEKDEEILPLYKPSASDAQPAQVDHYDEKTALLSPRERALAIKGIIDVARKNELSAAGVYASGSEVHAIGNSEGVFEYYRESVAECSLTITVPESDASGWAKADFPRADDINTQEMAESATQKARAGANPVELEPGRFDVVFEASGVLDLLSYLWSSFSATSVMDKRSCFENKLGQKVLGDNITITDDVTHPLQSGAPFDGEGLARTKVRLVDKGAVSNLVYGRRSARDFGVAPTGHGEVEPSVDGERVENMVVEGGTTSLQDMIKGVKRGILVTRVWYVRQVRDDNVAITGMTRDGTFLIEDGRITKAVKNLRFNQSVLEMLNHVEALGPSVRAAGEESIPAVVPPMLVKGFNFTSSDNV